jgi:TonB family protein
MRLSKAVLLLSVLIVSAPSARAQEPEKPLPNVVEHVEPVYPALARQARIMGEVRIRFTTDGQSVISAEAESGHELLRQSAVQNVRTWKFATHDPDTFKVTFRYKIMDGEKDVVFLPSPAVVEISVAAPTVEIDCASLGLGKWRARLRNSRGSSSFVVNMYGGGGCNGHALDGDVTNAQGQKEEIDFGYCDWEQSMIGFTVKFIYPKGKSFNTFFIGKMSGDNLTGDKLAGTFVDANGVTGQWTAIRDKKQEGST